MCLVVYLLDHHGISRSNELVCVRILHCATACGSSLKRKQKKVGPHLSPEAHKRTEHTNRKKEDWFPTTWVLLLRYLLNKTNSVDSRPYPHCFSKSNSWLTASNAIHKSINTAPVKHPWSKFRRIMLVNSSKSKRWSWTSRRERKKY